MKRKRKSFCPSPLLDDSPKRIKVQAQRKFAQGSNVNSPVITPIKELEAEIPRIDTLPEPVELLPIKRPNTEDFLTFLCFRGTPILPPSLNFFNTASIVDTNGQVHEIKSESSPKNGPIDIGKCGSSSEKPFIAFGVRKRADPIVISRQMDRKRRHALAIQALRRKYQEQKMAKIRAVAISKLSEKVTNKTLVKTNTVSKTELVTKKNNTLQKIKVVATKHVKVTTQTQRTTVRPKINQKMCLRSFRGRFVQKELPFRKKIVSDKKVINRTVGNVKQKTENLSKKEGIDIAQGSSSKVPKVIPKIVKKPVMDSTPKILMNKSSRVTRSGIIKNNLTERRKQKRMLISNPKTLVKPRTLRTTTMKKTVLSRRKSMKAQQRPCQKEKPSQNNITAPAKDTDSPSDSKPETTKSSNNIRKDNKIPEKKVYTKNESKKFSNRTAELKRDFRKITDVKKESSAVYEKDKEKKQINKFLDIRKEISKSTDIKGNVSKTVQIKRSTRISNLIEKVNLLRNKPRKSQFRRFPTQENNQKSNTAQEAPQDKGSIVKNETKPSTRSQDTKKSTQKDADIDSMNDTANLADKLNVSKNKNKMTKIVKKAEPLMKLEKPLDKSKRETNNEGKNVEDKKETAKEVWKKKELSVKTDDIVKSEVIPPLKRKPLGIVKAKKDAEKNDDSAKKHNVPKLNNVKSEKNVSPKMIPRPTRKTKEAAAIYMEILSHKLVNEGRIDDDNVSIDSFPELPNVKKTEQRENELKAKAKRKGDIKKKVKSIEAKPTIIENIVEHHEEKQIVKEQIKSNVKDLKSPRNSPKHISDVIEKTELKEKIDNEENVLSHQTIPGKNTKSPKNSPKHVPNLLEENSHLLLNASQKNEIDKDVQHTIKGQKLKSPKNSPRNVLNILEEKGSVQANVSEKTELSADIERSHKAESVQLTSDDSDKKLSQVTSTAEIAEALSDKLYETNLKNPEHVENIVPIKSVEVSGHLKTITTKNEIEIQNDELVKTTCKDEPEKTKPAVLNKDNETGKLKQSKIEASIKGINQIPVTEQKQTKNTTEAKDTGVKRKTRSTGSQLTKTESSDDSDQSFHLDVKVPRKKKMTRSKTVSKIVKTDEKLEETTKPINKQQDSSDSDESTSDINLQALANRQKNKRFTKKRSVKKMENSFCDSDEEPLSKLTNKNVDENSKSGSSQGKIKILENKKETKSDNKNEVSGLKKTETEPQPKEITKPKRECAKRPQNYLPMLSSSDDEDIFHGFDAKAANKNSKSVPNPPCTHAPPLIDFLTKDIGRRWGKEKVNMSNEQIEKWLKDSALAGSSIKKENDEMLKFGERIPTETSESPETDKKIPIFQIESEIHTKESVSKQEKLDSKEMLKQQIDSIKPLDRKLIFRKNKSDSTPNVNAFSPENESSVYAFGEESEDLISTPFRRPSRRPSSTATSRSEDESSKNEDSLKSGHFRKPSAKQEISKSHSKEDLDTVADIEDSSAHFYIPQNPTKLNISKPCQSSSKIKLGDAKPTLKISKSNEKIFDSEDYKYKVPSSPSASSSSSTKLYKRQPQKQKTRTSDSVSPIFVSDFPKRTDPSKMVEAPVFHPTEQEFQDPLEYIERLRHKAEQFGICRIVPPSSFKPECKVSDDMRFTAYNQYVHKMLHRWGPNFKELMAIKKYLATQNISITHPPWIGGMEIDLPRLYQTVQNLGGLKEVIEKKKWPRVSEFMKIPKSAQDRVTKLDDIYCKYLLPYDTLSPAEREKLFDEVETEWAKRESRSLVKAESKGETDANVEDDPESEPEDNDAEECTTKGRNMALNAFYRIARNTMSMYFKNSEPSAQEVEDRYWNYVMARQNHICVHSGSIDSGSWGYGFAVGKNSPFARHPWNLKVLTNNSGSFLKSLGPVMGVTVPTLHVGMVFSSCCWYRDPHGLPWIEYLHTGASKIWYGIPNSASDVFRVTLKKLVPNYCRNKELWLPSDTVMVPPTLLVSNNVSLCRTVQQPGQFIVVFPKAFTSSISTGYVVSESVYFAPSYWLKMAKGLFDALKDSKEPSMFSLDRLLVSIAQDAKCNLEILGQTVPFVEELCIREKAGRSKLKSFGKLEEEKLPEADANKTKKKKVQQGDEGDYECEICRTSLFVSMLFDTQEGINYCLAHGIEAVEQKKAQFDKCKLMFTYEEEELENLCEKIKITIENKLQKKGLK